MLAEVDRSSVNIQPIFAEVDRFNAIQPILAEVDRSSAIQPILAEVDRSNDIHPILAEVNRSSAIQPILAEVDRSNAIPPTIDEVDGYNAADEFELLLQRADLQRERLRSLVGGQPPAIIPNTDFILANSAVSAVKSNQIAGPVVEPSAFLFSSYDDSKVTITEASISKKLSDLDAMCTTSALETEIQIKQLWPEHAASRQRAYQRHCEVHQAASNIRNVFLKMSGVASLLQLQEANVESMFDLSTLSSQQSQNIFLEHQRRLDASVPGQWWRSQIHLLEIDPEMHFAANNYDDNDEDVGVNNSIAIDELSTGHNAIHR